MDIFAWADKKIKTYGVWDIAVLKIYCAAFGIIIGAYFPAFVFFKSLNLFIILFSKFLEFNLKHI